MEIKCDFCGAPATHDTKTVIGPWAHVCKIHFEQYSTKQPGLYSELKDIKESTKMMKLTTAPADTKRNTVVTPTDSKGAIMFSNILMNTIFWPIKLLVCLPKYLYGMTKYFDLATRPNAKYCQGDAAYKWMKSMTAQYAFAFVILCCLYTSYLQSK